MNPSASLGLIVNTYNQPDFLNRVLRGIVQQTCFPKEVLIADDGSGDETRKLIEAWSRAQSFQTLHVWQRNEGFRRSRILNEAISQATSEYLVFLDGDSIPHPHFVADHLRLARPKTFVQGHRALIERKATAFFGSGPFSSDRRRAFWRVQIRGLKHAFRWPFPLRRFRQDLRGVRGCNLAIWRADLMAVNGYNEAFVGWGREDSELSLRLMNSGVRRLDVRGWAICYHLWHPPASRAALSANDQLLANALSSTSTSCTLGLNQHRTSDPTRSLPT